MKKDIYTAQQLAEKCAIPLHTLRFYLKIGLMPFVQRHANGQRCFSENDVAWLEQLRMLKRMGLTLKEIQQYIIWVQQGDETLPQRLNLFQQQRQSLQEQIQQLQRDLQFAEEKCQIYQNAIEQGNITTAQCVVRFQAA